MSRDRNCTANILSLMKKSGHSRGKCWVGSVLDFWEGVEKYQRWRVGWNKKPSDSKGVRSWVGVGRVSVWTMASDPTPAKGSLFEVLLAGLLTLPTHSTDDWWHISSSTALHTKADSVPERVSKPRLEKERERKCAKTCSYMGQEKKVSQQAMT